MKEVIAMATMYLFRNLNERIEEGLWDHDIRSDKAEMISRVIAREINSEGHDYESMLHYDRKTEWSKNGRGSIPYHLHLDVVEVKDDEWLKKYFDAPLAYDLQVQKVEDEILGGKYHLYLTVYVRGVYFIG